MTKTIARIYTFCKCAKKGRLSFEKAIDLILSELERIISR